MDIISRALGGVFEARAAAGTSKMSTGLLPFLSYSGKSAIRPIHYKEALTLPAFYNAVDVISDSHGAIPYFVFGKTDNGRERMGNHPVDFALNHEPDGPAGVMSPFNFKKLIATSVKLRGNCLFRINITGGGAVALSYIDWSDVYDIRTHAEYGLTYHINGMETLFAYEVLHFRGQSLDGIVGIGALAYAAINMGMAIELQKFSYANAESKGVRQGVVETEKEITKESKVNIVTGVKNALSEKSADRFIVLDEGMKYKPITVTPQEAQLVEQGRFSIEDIARWVNIPLYKIKSLTQSTNNNVEQMALDYLIDTMLPLVTMVEQEKQRKLLVRKERAAGIYIKGNMNVLLRADMKTRAEFNSKMVNSGIYTVNEVRAFEEMNAKEGGDVLRFPVNTQTQEQIDKSLKDE